MGANLDGTDANQSFITAADGADGIAVDGQYVYWFRACEGYIAAALKRWEPGQPELGGALERARAGGEPFQFESSWRIGEPLPLGLYRTGDSALT